MTFRPISTCDYPGITNNNIARTLTYSASQRNNDPGPFQLPLHRLVFAATMPPSQTSPAPAAHPVSYGQVIEYIQGMSIRVFHMAARVTFLAHRYPTSTTRSDYLCFSRPHLPCLLHPSTKRDNPIPIPLHNKSLSSKAIFQIPARSDSGARIVGSKGTPSSLFYRRR